MGSLANGAHIHGPAAPGTTGPVAFDLQQPQTTAFDLMAGPFSPSAAQLDALRNGLMYADAHTEGARRARCAASSPRPASTA